ncbi:hypothetical protein B5F07_00545 [Lachnoclostridium sp. An169]|uniref:LTA synthase family protein n=1 Tax=Lachnoclostridium sp. An169 TaxID=1965569 RepID=UPI000B3A426C|nr:LTA synthase family protein [Lachnoclostridium sp. An169]OUP86514.1 hypothetical protein B5F07_00545 [Lachnoclostridium sp. An169]
MRKKRRFFRNWRLCIPVIFIYMETVFHLYMGLDMKYTALFVLFDLAVGLLLAGILYFLKERPARIAGAVLTAGLSLLFVAECICRDILQQYYQFFSAVETAAGNHLTDYLPAVVQSIVRHIPGIFLLMVIPLGFYAVCVILPGRRNRMRARDSTASVRKTPGNHRSPRILIEILVEKAGYFLRKRRMRKGLACILLACFIQVVGLGIMNLFPWSGDFTPDMLYQVDTNAEDQVEQLGLVTMLRLDMVHFLHGGADVTLPEINRDAALAVSGEDVSDSGDGKESDETGDGAEESGGKNGTGNAGEKGEDGGKKDRVYPYNALDIDFEALKASAPNEDSAWLDEYFESVVPTRQNKYTGMFEGYNVIFITAEGFSGYMIDPEITPTLYRLSHEGFVFENFYSTLHFTSTSGGEFQNLTGLYPKAGFPVSMSETGKQGTSLPFNLASQLNRLGYTSIGYHYNQNMYGRELSHPNLGYNWRQFTNCAEPLSPETNSNGYVYWPQSDDYMIEQTFSEYADRQPFNIYYLTISGHLPYGFSDSQMSARNEDAVQSLPYSEKTKAYIAANLELEKGLTRLVNYLEDAGIADKTVIVMAPDHIPYSDLDVLEELSGQSFNSETLENLNEKNLNVNVYKNTWILWSASMEEPVVVDKPCSQVDILPTVSNLLGLQYDSRMLAGTDVLSTSDPVVIFYSHSWLTEKGMYDRYSGTFTPAQGVEMSQEEQNVYVENTKYIVESRLKLGQLIIENDYYRQAVPW